MNSKGLDVGVRLVLIFNGSSSLSEEEKGSDDHEECLLAVYSNSENIDLAVDFDPIEIDDREFGFPSRTAPISVHPFEFQALTLEKDSFLSGLNRKSRFSEFSFVKLFEIQILINTIFLILEGHSLQADKKRAIYVLGVPHPIKKELAKAIPNIYVKIFHASDNSFRHFSLFTAPNRGRTASKRYWGILAVTVKVAKGQNDLHPSGPYVL